MQQCHSWLRIRKPRPFIAQGHRVQTRGRRLCFLARLFADSEVRQVVLMRELGTLSDREEEEEERNGFSCGLSQVGK